MKIGMVLAFLVINHVFILTIHRDVEWVNSIFFILDAWIVNNTFIEFLFNTCTTNILVCLDSGLFLQIYLLTSPLQFSIQFFIFSIIFLSHIHHITKSGTVKISQITYNPNTLFIKFRFQILCTNN